MSNKQSTDLTSEQQFANAVAIANVPTLLMVLVQLTGQMHWLESPYRPARGRGMGDNDSGGLPPEIQEEIRTAALQAILAWHNGRAIAIPEPSPSQLVEMLSVSMGEEIPTEYGEFTSAQLGYRPVPTEHIPMPEGFNVLIVGAGVSGICAAVHLKAAGIPFTVIEKNATVGGTWLENRYPGAGVDTPNHLYSFSFLSYDWKKYFALRDELYEYLQHVANEFELAPEIQFNTEVKSASYHEQSQTWEVEVLNPNGTPETIKANVVIGAIGIFNPLVYPDINGLETFEGPSFHTADWPEDINLDNKRIAIIGNGASCMQIAPEIQNQVDSLTIFQRSPHWAAPFEQFRREVPEPLRFLLKELPIYQAWYRVRLGWTFNDRVHASLQKDPDWEFQDRSLNATNDAHRNYYSRYIIDQLGERTDLLAKVMPTYPPFGKRMLMDNGWYSMLNNPKVELVDNPVVEIGPDSIMTEDGSTFDADVLILATGFDVLRFNTAFEVTGRSGTSLRDAWQDDNAKAYIGTTIPDFPNFYMLYGPNLQPGHGGSLIFVVEMQVHYIMDALRKMSEQGIAVVECRQDVYDNYNEAIDAAHEKMVWTHKGMSSYYRNNRGRIVVNSPYRNVDYYKKTREINLEDFNTEPI
ncbi:MAG: NAD(P)/FAD-dependent oxidoreductase [Pseudomonadales bacterium]|nr:NAD(P)/FAD-dependent oxidoreductase [Pseudomonadales bacterium]